MSTPKRIGGLTCLLTVLWYGVVVQAQSVLYSPAILPMVTGQLVAQPDGQVVVSPTPGVVLSVQPDGKIETRPASAIAAWELASRVGSSLLRFDGAGTARYLFVQELTPQKPPAPVESSFHIAAGPLSIARVQEVLLAAGREFPQLLQAFPTNERADAAAEEFLRRVIWHLWLAGFEAGRQKNPSGAISLDKLCVKVNGQWQAVDLGSLGYAGVAEKLNFQLISGANPVEDQGLAD